MVVFGQGGSIRTKFIVIGKKLLYSGESGCNPETVVVFGPSGCIREKVVVFGQKLLYLGKSTCIRGKTCIGAKVFLFGQKAF